MALPFPDARFDAAVMPLVIFFLTVPARGVAEMARVVRPSGIVTAYGWDLDDGGSPYDILVREIRAMGLEVPAPPSPDASRRDRLHELWTGAGLEAVETVEIVVERSFADFAEYWATVLGSPSVGRQLRALSAIDAATLQGRLRSCLPADATGRITCRARANAVRGIVPSASS